MVLLARVLRWLAATVASADPTAAAYSAFVTGAGDFGSGGMQRDGRHVPEPVFDEWFELADEHE